MEMSPSQRVKDGFMIFSFDAVGARSSRPGQGDPAPTNN